MLCYEKKKNALTVRLSGELDHSVVTAIRGELVFDLKGLEFMDSSGIGLIIGRYKVMSRRGGSVAVSGTDARIDQLFRMAGIYQLVERLA